MPSYITLTIYIFTVFPVSIIFIFTLLGLDDLRNEFISKFLIAVFVLALVALACVLIVLGLFKLGTSLVDKLSSRSYEIKSPTPQAEVQNIESRGATVQESSDNSQRSGGENKGFDFGRYKPGSNEAANAYKQSQEHKNMVEGIRQIDEILKAARKELSV